MIALEPTLVLADKKKILFLKIKCFENEIFQKLSSINLILLITKLFSA